MSSSDISNTDSQTEPSLPLQHLLELRYRRLVFRLFYLIIAACLLSLLYVLRVNYGKWAEEDWYSVIFHLVVAASVPLTILVRSLFFFAPRLLSRYQADASKLMIESRKNRREIYYEQIERICFSKLPPRFFGGFRIRLKSGVWLRFPTLMTGCAELLLLIRRERPDLASFSEFENFLHKLRLVEISWQRWLDKLKSWKLLIFKYLAYPTLLTLGIAQFQEISSNDPIFWKRPFALFWLIFSLHFLIAMLINHFEERMNNQHLRPEDSSAGQHPVVIERDLEQEKKLSLGAQVIFYAVSLSLLGATYWLTA